MLQFDEDTARILEDAYKGADITRRRRASFDALAPAPGEHLLDLGCGNGLLTLDLSRAVGDTGHVLGLDPSPDMLDLARARAARIAAMSPSWRATPRRCPAMKTASTARSRCKCSNTSTTCAHRWPNSFAP